MDPRGQDNFTRAYNEWVSTRSPEAMAGLVDQFGPTINSELVQYSGPKSLLRSRARLYAIKAIESYDPNGKARLHSWVVTNLRQLARYSKQLRPIHASDDMVRNAAELNSVARRMEDDLGRKPTDAELQDETGWSERRIGRIRSAVPAAVTAGAMEDRAAEEDAVRDPANVRPDPMPYASEAVYASLGERDRTIFDSKVGGHGRKEMKGVDIAKMLGVTPALVSQRSSDIGRQIADFAGRPG